MNVGRLQENIMSDQRFVVAAPKLATLPVAGDTRLFPVRRIYCIGRNYVAHVREMGGDEARDPPIIFQKPADTIMPDGSDVPYPKMTNDFHYELELVVAMKSGGYDIPETEALDHVFGYGIGLDMTRRTVIDAPARPNLPWELKKSFDQSCPCGPIHTVEDVGHIDTGAIKLVVDGDIRQDSDLGLMIWRTPEIIANLSKYFSLEAGDIIMTGTPSGVGPVVPGNRLVGSIAGLGAITINITN
jgi:fumarylpyruvate hydrolase